MILVLLGTNPHPFMRLLNEVERIAEGAEEHFVVQTGTTPYQQASGLECYNFVEKEKLLGWIEEAELVVCQGGFGSISDCMQAGKKIISVPRRPQFGESTDEQEELVKAFDEMGYLIGVYDVKDLGEALMRCRMFSPKRAEESNIPGILSDYIHNLLGVS